MAIPFVDSSTFAAILKDLQEGRMASALNNQSPMWKYVQNKLKKNVALGRTLRRPVKVARGIAAAGNIGYSGSFKTKYEADVQSMTAKPKYMTAHIEVPWSVMESGKQDVGRFIDPMKLEMEDKQEALARVMSRQAYGDGSGVIGTVASIAIDAAPAPDQATITLSSASSAQGWTGWFEVGDVIEIYSSAAVQRAIGAGENEAVVLSIDVDNNTVTYQCADGATDAAAGAIVATDVVIRTGITLSVAGDYNARSEELTGFESLIDDSNNVYGIDRSAYPNFQASVVDASAAPLDTIHLLQGVQKSNKAGGGKLSVFFMYHDTYNRLAEIAEEDKRYVNTKDAALGFDKLSFASLHGPVQFEVDEFCRPDRVFGIDTRYVEIYGKDFDFLDENGKIIRLKPASAGGHSPDYTAELIGSCELFILNPASCLKLKNFTLS